MSPRKARKLSLKRRLLLTLLPPLCCILLALGLSGAWLVKRIVEDASDRVLSGSLQAVSETLEMQEGYLTMDLPPSALGMLENPDRDAIYYSVTYRGKLITGYPELAVHQPVQPRIEGIRFSNSVFHGEPIRIASEARLVPQLDAPVIVQVAETVKNRTALVQRMLIALAIGETILLVTVIGLVMLAVDWGLRPLALLRREVEARNDEAEIDFAPLPLSSVPQEVLPFVSAFNTLLDHVDRSFQTLRRFTSDASHQLRVPLAVVRAHVELLRRDGHGSPEMRDALTDIHQAVRALQHLIVQLISLAKAERPNGDEADAGSFDAVECTAAAARTYAVRALEKGMELSFEADCEMLMLAGNAIFVGEMIGNLLDNAVLYGNAGGQIVVRVDSRAGTVEVEDDGPGIPEGARERVFERFYRLPRNGDREGSGLGLSIVRALGRRMGATVSLETPAGGHGVKAVVRFPLPPSGSAAARLAPAPQKLGADEAVQAR
ncbi:sensor histidine kinase [Sphingomonas quercus]|uniref:histidine kinase n=1 Tax=Sphingomonas quercus TaxID=2842451 RepID=A0ABS6BJN5_9SPHN|nr:sensor histidine kinase [Sphingomonas quercus]MBU3077410.1 sensor histidine kinase [Sphingomonas quercus]